MGNTPQITVTPEAFVLQAGPYWLCWEEVELLRGEAKWQVFRSWHCALQDDLGPQSLPLFLYLLSTYEVEGMNSLQDIPHHKPKALEPTTSSNTGSQK